MRTLPALLWGLCSVSVDDDAGRQDEAFRIYGRAIADDLIMHMDPRGTAGTAHVSNKRVALHELSFFHQTALQMRVFGVIAIPMVQYNEVTVIIARFRRQDDTIGGGIDGRPATAGDIQTGVKDILAGDRIDPVAKGTGPFALCGSHRRRMIPHVGTVAHKVRNLLKVFQRELHLATKLMALEHRLKQRFVQTAGKSGIIGSRIGPTPYPERRKTGPGIIDAIQRLHLPFLVENRVQSGLYRSKIRLDSLQIADILLMVGHGQMVSQLIHAPPSDFESKTG